MKPKLVDSQPFQLCSSELCESGRSQPPCLLGFLPCYTAMWKQISEAMSQKPCFASDVFPLHPAALCELWFWRMVNSHFAWNAHTHTQTDTQTQTYRQTHTQTDTHTHTEYQNRVYAMQICSLGSRNPTLSPFLPCSPGDCLISGKLQVSFCHLEAAAASKGTRADLEPGP